MDWEKYKKEQIEHLTQIRDYLGKALELIEETAFYEVRSPRFAVSKAKNDVDFERFALSRSGEEDESIFKYYTLQNLGQGLPVEGFEYVDVSQCTKVRCLFPDGMRTFHLDMPVSQVNIVSIKRHLDTIQDEIDQDQIME